MFSRLLLAITLLSVGAAHAASTVYSMEQSFADRAVLPQEVVALVQKQLEPPAYEQYRCQGTLEQNLEGQRVNLGGQLQSALLVKPQGMCLCGAHSCVIWVFRKSSGHWVLAGDMGGHSLELIPGRSDRTTAEFRALPGGANERTVRHYRYLNGKYRFYKSSELAR